MDYFELQKSVFCLNTVLGGAQIKSCGQLSHKGLAFHIRSETLDAVLLIELAGHSSGLYLLKQRLPKESQTLLARSFRNKLSGAYIVGLDMPFPDRIATIELKMAEWQFPRDLWIEFCGNRSNIILVEKNSEKIEALLFKMNREKGTTLVLVTHDNELAEHCDRQLTMNAGELVETTSANTINRKEAV